MKPLIKLSLFSKQKYSKAILIVVVFVFLLVGGVVGGWLYLNEIDNRYGVLQELYFEAETGNLIVHEASGAFGIVNKGWGTLTIRSLENTPIDLMKWVSSRPGDISIYKFSASEINTDSLTVNKLQQLIRTEDLILVTSH